MSSEHLSKIIINIGLEVEVGFCLKGFVEPTQPLEVRTYLVEVRVTFCASFGYVYAYLIL